MGNIETYEADCICTAKLRFSVHRQLGHLEEETCCCPNCGKQFTFRASMPILEHDIVLLQAGYQRQPQDLDPRVVFDILKKKGATKLYHANTGLTSLTFLQQERLLSRKQVRDRGLAQTPQYTDKIDERYGILDDIFMDVVDIHVQAGSYNKYGPMLFEFPLATLRDWPFVFVRVTRCNPSDWTDALPLERRYYLSESDFNDGYTLGNFGSMLIFHHIGGEFPLAGNLDRILVDRPGLGWKNVELHEEAISYFEIAARDTNSNIRTDFRQCGPGCSCKKAYESTFGPKIKQLFTITET